mmetsp:Transcript_11383/g.26336  ORF Transcript_11383/g.26336 Transcript_11383/m.26336 type:complete len:479 (+) Transcript_11383:79-1515(+)|eukprot:CAMPEP_0182564368 /NCGR_PEP_ID=MMETSP1324-20130603/6313_1 /TAXON_ID=236786 /ORGANISM="Florenciella sp., Strain RCC1587" /LENGTH=478 /DNA_ID=CAMNT_0024777809 /DNA_START=62 /DNA_END=1498 /DNA_ORIENTATION=+
MLTLKHLETLVVLLQPGAADASLESIKSLAAACNCSVAIGGASRRTKIGMINDILTALLTSTETLSTMMKVTELRAFIDQHNLESISKQTGGRARRTKDDMLVDVVVHLAKAAVANMTTNVAEAEAEAEVEAETMPSTPFTPRSEPESTSTEASPLSVADLETLLNPGNVKIGTLEGIGRAQQLENVGKLCLTGTKNGLTKAHASGNILTSLAERGVPARSFSGQLKALRDLVADHRLEVDTHTGGKNRRTNEDIVSDILRYASTPEYKARLIRNYTNEYTPTKTTATTSTTTTTTTTASVVLNGVRTNLFPKAEDPGVLDVRPGAAAATAATATATSEPTAASTADVFWGLFTWLGLIIGLAIWQWHELAGDALSDLKVALRRRLWYFLEELSIRSYGFLQTLRSLELDPHAPALKLALPGAAASLRLDRGTALLGLGAVVGWLVVLVAAACQSGRVKAATIPTPTRRYSRPSSRAR